MESIGNYEILSDRIKSLLERWDKYKSSSNCTDLQAINGLLSEINDDYTKTLIESSK
jgi:phage terminase large subunit-like protein